MNKLASEAYVLLCKKASEDLPVNPYSHYVPKHMGAGATIGAGLGAIGYPLSGLASGKPVRDVALGIGALALGGGLVGGALGAGSGTIKAMRQNGRVMYNQDAHHTYMR